jgi:phosphoglycerate dehydrogenase-like enzyme
LVTGKVAAQHLMFLRRNRLKTINSSLPNVIATPHMGAQTFEAQHRASIQIANNVIDALEKLKL